LREVPEVPLPEGQLRVLISSDTATEVDDQHAIVYALLAPERFLIEGFVGTHFGESGGPTGAQKSCDEISTILEKMGFEDTFAIRKGGDPLQYTTKAEQSAGADFIVQRAHAEEDQPLYVMGLGAATDIASAYLKDPSIKDRIVVVWHGRTKWPDKAWNFNVHNDLKAAQVLFRSQLPLILFDTGTFLYCPYAESTKRISPCGRIGKYLHEIRSRKPRFQSDDKAMFDMGDIAFALNASWCKWEEVDAPDVRVDYSYDFSVNHGPIIRVYDVDRLAVFEDFYQRLKDFSECGDQS